MNMVTKVLLLAAALGVGISLLVLHRPSIQQKTRGRASWEAAENSKELHARFNMSRQEFESIAYWVVSLERAVDRRETLAESLRQENVTYQMFNAYDGAMSLPQVKLQTYISRRYRLKATLGSNHRAHHIRAEIAAELSHLSLMEQSLHANQNIVVQMEDDTTLVPGFKTALYETLLQLPSDWDLLYLYTCERYDKLGKQVGKGVQVLRWGLCTNAFVYRSTSAMKILEQVKKHRACDPFDIVLAKMTEDRTVHSYIAQPLLAKALAGVSFIG